MTKTVYIIEDNQLVERDYAELCREFAEETTTPHGVDTKFHVRGCELWTWGYLGSAPKMVEAFDSQEEAGDALLKSFEHDLDNADDAPIVFDSREEAESFLEAIADEDD